MSNGAVEILIVEDNPNDLELTLHALRKGALANQIAVARDGEEALEYLFCRGQYAHRRPEDAPKMILLDLKLPKITGLQVLTEIKAHPATKSIPVVVLTASREQSDLIESYQIGVNAYIQKPVDFDSFRNAVKILGMFWLVVNQAPPIAANQVTK